MLIVVTILLAIEFALGFFIKPAIIAIEDKHQVELETWKLEAAGETRKDPVNRSRSTLKGKIAEQLASVLPGFLFNPAVARFIGSPVDYSIFYGLTEVSDKKKQSVRIVFMDVKKGGGILTRRSG
jgi:predicted Holliday junction resolvase-like endonuclease